MLFKASQYKRTIRLRRRKLFKYDSLSSCWTGTLQRRWEMDYLFSGYMSYAFHSKSSSMFANNLAYSLNWDSNLFES